MTGRPTSSARRALGLTVSVAGAALVFTLGASAQSRRLPVRVGAETAFSECYCRAGGKRYEVGEQACIRTPGSARLASCRMEQNVTSWRMHCWYSVWRIACPVRSAE